jgi:hypothetical protein
MTSYGKIHHGASTVVLLLCLGLFVALVRDSRLRRAFHEPDLQIALTRDKGSILSLHPNPSTGREPTQQSEQCRRYALVTCPAKAGLGHKMVCIMLGHRYALENNATLVINKGILAGEKVGSDHGEYPWAVDFFGLSPVLDQYDIDTSSLTVIKEDTWYATFDAVPICDVLFRTNDASCSDYHRETGFVGKSAPWNRWCYKKWLWILPSTRQYLMDLREKYGSTTALHPELKEARDRGFVDVVWHVRWGDAKLMINTRKRFIDAMLENLNVLFGATKLKVIVVSEDDTIGLDFHSWFQTHGAIFLPSMEVSESLQVMIDSSVLVTSGSAFAITATVYKPHNSLCFQVRPKGVDRVGDVFQHAIVGNNGGITYPPDLNMLSPRVEAILSTIQQP